MPRHRRVDVCQRNRPPRQVQVAVARLAASPPLDSLFRLFQERLAADRKAVGRQGVQQRPVVVRETGMHVRAVVPPGSGLVAAELLEHFVPHELLHVGLGDVARIAAPAIVFQMPQPLGA